jgi:hypothetical protein
MRVTLAEIEAAVRGAWSHETAFARFDYLDGAAELAEHGRGQCGPTAMVVQDLLGGDLLIADLAVGGVVDGVHYWNRFGAVEVDLTRDQFLANEVVGEARVVERPVDGIKPGPARDAYELLRKRVFAVLASADGVAGLDG